MPTAKKSSVKSAKASIKPASKTIDLIAALQEHFGFDAFKGNQKAIIENLMAGNDTFVIMPTGGGKSLCYQLPGHTPARVRHYRIAADRPDEKPGGPGPRL